MNGYVPPAEVSATATAHPYLPLITRKPCEFKTWKTKRSAARGGTKTAYLKNQAVRIAEDMHMLSLHLRTSILGCNSMEAGFAEQEARLYVLNAFGICRRRLPIRLALSRPAQERILGKLEKPFVNIQRAK
ncbi:hypothetical protein PCS_00436 [Desulfocurvibacter africanus PCS]|uniref:Uncharacterized protein n=1 Tax=Desulfocurvibacter africanus PCS TaxID=1262666 RepID=M5PWV6_DESAF|nr:hypothetical protein PCS_00436 [Desulfocurvibacter africanus PCS]